MDELPYNRSMYSLHLPHVHGGLLTPIFVGCDHCPYAVTDITIDWFCLYYINWKWKKRQSCIFVAIMFCQFLQFCFHTKKYSSASGTGPHLLHTPYVSDISDDAVFCCSISAGLRVQVLQCGSCSRMVRDRTRMCELKTFLTCWRKENVCRSHQSVPLMSTWSWLNVCHISVYSDNNNSFVIFL